MPTTSSFPPPRATGILLLLGGLVLLAGYLATPWEQGEATRASYEAAMAANPTQAQIAATLLHFGWLLLAPAMFGIVSLLWPRRTKLTVIAGVLAIAGTIGMPGLLISDFYDLALAQEGTKGVIERMEGFPLAQVIMLSAVFPAILGLALIPFAVWRAGLVATWVPFVGLAGTLVTFFGGTGLLSFGVGGTLVYVAQVAIALALLRPGAARATQPSSSGSWPGSTSPVS